MINRRYRQTQSKEPSLRGSQHFLAQESPILDLPIINSSKNVDPVPNPLLTIRSDKILGQKNERKEKKRDNLRCSEMPEMW